MANITLKIHDIEQVDEVKHVSSEFRLDGFEGDLNNPQLLEVVNGDESSKESVFEDMIKEAHRQSEIDKGNEEK